MDKYPEFILLSKIINKIKDEDYYRTFAKSLIMTNLPEDSMPADEDLVNEMFRHFIQTDNLQIFFDNTPVSIKNVQSEAESRTFSSGNDPKLNNILCAKEFELIFENEIYINTQSLKKLYANKCIVFPNSLLKD